MPTSLTYFFGITIFCVLLPITTKAQEPHCIEPPQIVTFKPQTIFDNQEQGFTFIHRWANAIHIDTKIVTLENEAAFFLNKCVKNVADMAELERYLRSQKYLRDAKVISDEVAENITVTTWDNWSLMPTISFGRKGGETSYSFGVKERNLLGLGIDVDISTYNNSQREGYRIKSTIPLFKKQNIDLSFRFADNDDGTQQSLFLQKHFASFYTNYAYNIGFDEESRNNTTYQNDTEQAIYAHKLRYKSIEYAWLSNNDDESLLRFYFGVTQDQHTFSNLTNSALPLSSSTLPQDRDFIYPWLQIDYIQKDFKKLTNIHLITQIEDFNHGWQFSSTLGLSDGNKQNSAWALFKTKVSKGFEVHYNALILMDLALEADIYDQQQRFLFHLNSEYFYNLSEHWGVYLSNTNVLSKNQYLDNPVTMGASTGLRGFPLQYQHGEHSTKFTSEIRYYPGINLFKLFDLAAAGFFDTGRTFGESVVENIESTWLHSVGIGIRLYSPHSTGNNQIIHIDFAFPQSENPTVDSFEIRVEAKKSF